MLVVEDNLDHMLTILALLAYNYAIIEALDGQSAIELSSQHIPDLFLMDIAIPLVDGVQAFKTIRNTSSTQHMTANAIAEDRQTILAHGFDGYTS